MNGNEFYSVDCFDDNKESRKLSKAKDLLWLKYKDACVGFAFSQETLIYSYCKMLEIENSIVNDDNLANANVYDFIKEFSDKKRMVYLDETGISEYPFDNKIDFIVEGWQNGGIIDFSEEIDVETNVCNIIVKEIPTFFKQQDNVDIFLKHIENSAKYMKIKEITLYFLDDAHIKWKELFGENVETDAVNMFIKNGWCRTEDWELTFIKTYGNKK
jgi:hypothetical protein